MSDTLVYDSACRPHPAIEELTEIRRYRDMVVQLVRRDIVARYKRSSLGVAWTMLNPLATMLVMTIVFSQLFGRTRAYPAYVLSGLLAWHLFSRSTLTSMRQLIWGGPLIHRIYIPKTAFALSALGTGLVNLALSLVPLAIVMAITRVPIRPALLFLPVAVLLLAAFTLGVSLLLSTLAVYFVDVAEMYEIASMVWMYLTPIVYPESVMEEGYRRWLLLLNPMSHMVRLFRHALYLGTWPPLADVGVTAAMAAAMLGIGWIVFARQANEFAYRI